MRSRHSPTEPRRSPVALDDRAGDHRKSAHRSPSGARNRSQAGQTRQGRIGIRIEPADAAADEVVGAEARVLANLALDAADRLQQRRGWRKSPAQRHRRIRTLVSTVSRPTLIGPSVGNQTRLRDVEAQAGLHGLSPSSTWPISSRRPMSSGARKLPGQFAGNRASRSAAPRCVAPGTRSGINAKTAAITPDDGHRHRLAEGRRLLLSLGIGPLDLELWSLRTPSAAVLEAWIDLGQHDAVSLGRNARPCRPHGPDAGPADQRRLPRLDEVLNRA